jgi:hypothetical protein
MAAAPRSTTRCRRRPSSSDRRAGSNPTHAEGPGWGGGRPLVGRPRVGRAARQVGVARSAVPPAARGAAQGSRTRAFAGAFKRPRPPVKSHPNPTTPNRIPTHPRPAQRPGPPPCWPPAGPARRLRACRCAPAACQQVRPRRRRHPRRGAAVRPGEPPRRGAQRVPPPRAPAALPRPAPRAHGRCTCADPPARRPARPTPRPTPRRGVRAAARTCGACGPRARPGPGRPAGEDLRRGLTQGGAA